MNKLGLIGKSLEHSFSKNYFTQKFDNEGISNYSYHLFPLENIHQFDDLLQQIPELIGLNVTIPYKSSVLDYVHKKDIAVEEIGACNCLTIKNKLITAYNTDYIAFKNSLIPHLKPHHRNALLLGNGGAMKAIRYALQQMEISSTVVARNPQAGELEWNGLCADMIDTHSIIVNCTPLGMYPQVFEFPKIDYSRITHKHLIYDLIYNPSKSLFLQKSDIQCATIINGYQMLQLQAEYSWELFQTRF
jgi:shikimate dehydrogenase